MEGMTVIRWMYGIFITIAAFLTNPQGPFGEFWPPAEGRPAPTGILLPFFLLLNVIEAAALAAAVVLFFTAWPNKAIHALTLTETRRGFVCLLWILGNWWVHDGLHVHIGDDLHSLILVEYGFHVTIMAAAGYLLYLTSNILRYQK